MRVLSTVAGRFLVNERVAPLVQQMDSELKGDRDRGAADRYAARRAIFESLLARYGSPIHPVFALPATRRELMEVGL